MIRARLAFLASSAIVIAIAAFACAPEDVVLANLPAESEGGSQEGQRCVQDMDCPPAQLCQKASCTDATGTCEFPPPFCESDIEPVCGCDGISYTNDCLRKRGSSRASTPGPCVDGVTCGGPQNQACPVTGAICGKLVAQPTRCDPGVLGQCWVIPDECPPDAGGPLWIQCGPPGPEPCADGCNAIRSGEPFRPASPGDCPGH